MEYKRTSDMYRLPGLTAVWSRLPDGQDPEEGTGDVHGLRVWKVPGHLTEAVGNNVSSLLGWISRDRGRGSVAVAVWDITGKVLMQDTFNLEPGDTWGPDCLNKLKRSVEVELSRYPLTANDPETLPPHSISEWVHHVHTIAQDHGFWEDGCNDGEKIALMHGELSEALESLRSDPGAPCPKIPDITALEEEMADVVIRVMDYCAYKGIRLQYAIQRKSEYNAGRPYKHGKGF